MTTLTINIAAVSANYRAIQERVGPNCTVSGVVKANAYGLGVGPVSQGLYEEGCRLFFTATLPEALELRVILGEKPTIATLNGCDPVNIDLYKEANITPVLNHEGELNAYKAAAHAAERPLAAILQLDTGMNRLGFDAGTIHDLANDPDAFAGLDILYIMSHFACADEPDHPKNAEQYNLFLKTASAWPDLPKSICNSFGTYQNADWHLDMVRPGMALYGLNPTPYKPNPMQPVVKLETPILQIREAQKGEACGYNATFRFNKKTKLAIVSMGYADGILRSLTNKGALYWKGIRCPIRGRVSMDLVIVDLGAVPEKDLAIVGDTLEVIGPHQSADNLAHAAGTIGYEILTALGHRYERRYES